MGTLTDCVRREAPAADARRKGQEIEIPQGNNWEKVKNPLRLRRKPCGARGADAIAADAARKQARHTVPSVAQHTRIALAPERRTFRRSTSNQNHRTDRAHLLHVLRRASHAYGETNRREKSLKSIQND